MFWVVPTKIIIIINIITNKLYIEFKNLLGTTSFTGRRLPFVALFLFIVNNNFIGLFPYIFTASRHITLTLTLSLPL
jgi:F-type H+-transporting ATPase subunit a